MNEVRDLTLLLKSRFPIVVVETQEEARVSGLLENICNLEQWGLHTWSVADGLRAIRPTTSEDVAGETRSLEDALRHIEKSLQLGVYLLFDAQAFMDSPVNRRLVKEIALDYPRHSRTLVFVGHRVDLPEELRRLSARFELTLPDANALRAVLREEMIAWEREPTLQKLSGDPGTVNTLIQHLVGMPLEDARRLIRQSIRDDGVLNRDDVKRVLQHKHQAHGAAGALSLELDTASFASVGGQATLKRWLERRKAAFLGAGAHLPVPKGVLLLGVQGAGKSLAAKATAGAWGVALMRLDFGALYSKWSGETERNLRDALKAAEAMEPCVLWLDEIEKGLAPDSGGGDSGVSRRVLGALLTWMSERKARVFLAATANDISALPPELMRKGRFDEIFFVDLPDEATRAQIFAIHLRARGLDPQRYEVDVLAHAAAGFSGAEIEQAIVGALYEAAPEGIVDGRAIATEIARTRPLSVVMAERIAELREWAAGRTVPAN